MRLTRQTNYAMRILMYCAANDGRLSRIPEIARAYGVSELFLFKILQPLVENGLVETVRGRNGGVRLGRPADRDHALRHRARDRRQLRHGRMLRERCDGVPAGRRCALNEALRKALGAFFDVLERYTIEDLVKARPNMRSLLGIDVELPRACG